MKQIIYNRQMVLVIGCLFLLALIPTNVGATMNFRKPTPVKVVNPDSAPIPVKLQEKREEPVQAQETLVVVAGESSGAVDLYIPPAGKLLIIEYITIQVDSRNEEQGILILETNMNGEPVSHRLGPLPPQVYTGLGSGTTQTLQRSLLAYSDGVVSFRYVRGTGLDGERAIVGITMSGRLVDIPTQ